MFLFGLDEEMAAGIDIHPSQKTVFSQTAYEEWVQILPKLDIGLAPLDGSYDLRRGWINVLEYMALKIPWLASDQMPYRTLSQYGHLVQNSSSMWESVSAGCSHPAGCIP